MFHKVLYKKYSLGYIYIYRNNAISYSIGERVFHKVYTRYIIYIRGNA